MVYCWKSSKDRNVASTATHGPVMTEESMKAKVDYAGVVLTSIDVVPAPTHENPDRVTFSDLTVGSIDDDDALFIHNIREVKREVTGRGKKTVVEFEADKLTPATALEKLGSDDKKALFEQKVLFVIHGYNTRASYHLLDCLNAKDKFTKAHLIPVIWPSEGGGTVKDYKNDREYSKAAGKALQSMRGPLQKLSEKGLGSSIMCHSMGNRVLCYFSDPEINFDNIFMVAADVVGDLFHEGYINGGHEDWRQHGMNIKKMLTNPDTGKIHVIYNPSDSKMAQSRIFNSGTRLGGVGVNKKPARFGKTVHPDLKDVIINVNAQDSNFLYPEKPGKRDHNYHFYDNACKYYDEHA